MSAPRAAAATLVVVLISFLLGWCIENYPNATLGTLSVAAIYQHFRADNKTLCQAEGTNQYESNRQA